MASEVEETLKRLVAHKGVIGTIVVNTDGVPIKSTLDNATTVQYSGLLNNLVDQAKTMFKELDPTNDLTFLRIRTKVRCHIFNDSFSVAKATLQSQMSVSPLVCLSVIKTPQQLEIIIYHHSSFILHHPSFISRLLSFSACF